MRGIFRSFGIPWLATVVQGGLQAAQVGLHTELIRWGNILAQVGPGWVSGSGGARKESSTDAARDGGNRLRRCAGGFIRVSMARWEAYR